MVGGDGSSMLSSLALLQLTPLGFHCFLSAKNEDFFNKPEISFVLKHGKSHY